MGSIDPGTIALNGTPYVNGTASGMLIASNVELSFWGGVDPATGEVIDRHHPLSGHYLQDTIFAIPGGRGSCTGSGIMLQLLLSDKGPRALIFERREDILTLGVMIAEEIFHKSIPVVTLNSEDFRRLLQLNGREVFVQGGSISDLEPENASDCSANSAAAKQQVENQVKLTSFDRELLDGSHGEAASAAMRIILRMANLLGAQELLDVSQVHVDGCIYTGPASLAFAEKLRDLGGKVRVPTTMNSISIDQKRWRALGVETEFGEASSRLADAYVDMGARPTFTCAPYQLDSAPKKGDQVAWAESNAVIYANSVLGARTMKYPDFLDIAIALTGRAPKGGAHVEHNRLASLWVKVSDLPKDLDDSFYPLLGYYVGSLATSCIPVVSGIEGLRPSNDDLKAFGAAFATISSAPMFHVVGVTPEASTLEAVSPKGAVLPCVELGWAELALCWRKLNGAGAQQIDLVSLGNPHFSISEIRKLAQICQGKTKSRDTSIIVTCSRATHALATQAGLVQELEAFGVQFLVDTCWCMVTEPVIPRLTQVIMTNSGKYAHYGPGLTGRKFCFGSLAMCVEAACQGYYSGELPPWLSKRLDTSI